jgi:hypothetical protein
LITYQSTVLVSAALVEVITNDVPGVRVGDVRIPAVPPTVFVVRRIFEFAVTAVVLMVTVPATIAADVPVRPAAPVGTWVPGCGGSTVTSTAAIK